MKNFILLLFVVFLSEIATDIYVPVLPLFVDVFNTNLEVIQLTMSMHLLGFAIGQAFYGPLSDHYGRKITLLFGFILFVLATAICPFSKTIYTLIFFRFIQGLGACVAPVIGIAMIKDRCTESTANIKMLSFMSMTVSLSPIIGPILGVFIAEYSGWRGSFYLLTICGLMTLPLLIRLEESRHSNKLQKPFEMPAILTFIGLVLANALIVSCVWVFITAAPFILIKNYNVPLVYYGYYQSFTVIAYILGGLFTNRLVHLFGIRTLSLIGISIIYFGTIGLLGFWWIGNMSPFSFVGCVALIECGIGIFRPLMLNQVMDCFSGRSGFSAAVLGTAEMTTSAIAIGILGYFNQEIIGAVVGIYTFATLMTSILFAISCGQSVLVLSRSK